MRMKQSVCMFGSVGSLSFLTKHMQSKLEILWQFEPPKRLTLWKIGCKDSSRAQLTSNSNLSLQQLLTKFQHRPGPSLEPHPQELQLALTVINQPGFGSLTHTSLCRHSWKLPPFGTSTTVDKLSMLCDPFKAATWRFFMDLFCQTTASCTRSTAPSGTMTGWSSSATKSPRPWGLGILHIPFSWKKTHWLFYTTNDLSKKNLYNSAMETALKLRLTNNPMKKVTMGTPMSQKTVLHWCNPHPLQLLMVAMLHWPWEVHMGCYTPSKFRWNRAYTLTLMSIGHSLLTSQQTLLHSMQFPLRHPMFDQTQSKFSWLNSTQIVLTKYTQTTFCCCWQLGISYLEPLGLLTRSKPEYFGGRKKPQENRLYNFFACNGIVEAKSQHVSSYSTKWSGLSTIQRSTTSNQEIT